MSDSHAMLAAGTAYRTVAPEDEQPAIRMFCRKCWHRWFVSIPEQSVEDVCRGLRCRCGSDALGVSGGDVMRLLGMVRGTHDVV